MTVTDINLHIKDKYKIYIDDTYAFMLSCDDIGKYNIAIGNDISDDIYGQLRTLMIKRAKDKSLELLKRMEYSKFKLTEKLKQSGYTMDIIIDVLSYLEEYNFVNDERYAKMYIDSHIKSKSIYEIKAYLYQRGINNVIVDNIIKALEIDECDVIKNLIYKKTGYNNKLEKDEYKKIYTFLLRKGFEYNKIRSVLEEFK